MTYQLLKDVAHQRECRVAFIQNGLTASIEIFAPENHNFNGFHSLIVSARHPINLEKLCREAWEKMEDHEIKPCRKDCDCQT
jgi:hypothetical protein